jgi:hypothetical protein
MWEWLAVAYHLRLFTRELSIIIGSISVLDPSLVDRTSWTRASQRAARADD